jgi:hypothetical protein
MFQGAFRQWTRHAAIPIFPAARPYQLLGIWCAAPAAATRRLVGGSVTFWLNGTMARNASEAIELKIKSPAMVGKADWGEKEAVPETGPIEQSKP